MAKLASQIRLEEEIFLKVKTIAEKEKRSLNGQLEYFLEKCVEQYEKDNGLIEI